MFKPTKPQSITCECGTEIDTTNNPAKVVCETCGREYGKQAPQLLFLGFKREHFPAGTVIIS